MDREHGTNDAVSGLMHGSISSRSYGAFLTALAVLPVMLLLISTALRGTTPAWTFRILLGLTLIALPWILLDCVAGASARIARGSGDHKPSDANTLQPKRSNID